MTLIVAQHETGDVMSEDLGFFSLLGPISTLFSSQTVNYPKYSKSPENTHVFIRLFTATHEIVFLASCQNYALLGPRTFFSKVLQ